MTQEKQNIPLWFLYLSVITTGAMVMVIEVMGSRVVGPFYGVSLFVWTSLITVTLIALAGGYALGGIIADKWGKASVLYGLIGAAGLFCLLVPFVKIFVLQACQPLGLRVGALASTLILFGPSLFLLGCVSPLVIKLAAHDLPKLGKTVGGFYAVSTMGSVLGTIVTGFWLIGYLGVNGIFWLVGSLLLALCVLYYVLFRRQKVALVLLLPALIPFSHDEAYSATLKDGTHVEVVASQESYYGTMKVVDYRFEDTHTRELIIDGFLQGGIDMDSRLSVYEYAYLLQYLPKLLYPDGKNALVVGLGIGMIPTWFEQNGIDTDVVDIDPVIVKLAQKYFDYQYGDKVVIGDARHYLETNQKTYDYIVLDVFNGDITPGHILSIEALRAAKKHLSPNGILGANLVIELEGRTQMSASIVKTMENVFDHVEVFRAFDPRDDETFGNVAIIAYDGEKRMVPNYIAARLPYHEFAQYARRYVSGPIASPTHKDAIILDDNFNPIDFRDAWLREAIRRRILRANDPVLLGG